MAKEIKKPIIELKNVHHLESMSEETSCFDATLYVDGEAICTVSNHGQGGPDDYRHLPKNVNKIGVPKFNLTAKLMEIEERIKATYPKISMGSEEMDKKYGMIDPDLEIICGQVLSDFLMQKDFKNLLRRKVVGIDPEGQCVTWNLKPTPDILKRVADKMPDHKVLNGMAFEEAFPLYKIAAA